MAVPTKAQERAAWLEETLRHHAHQYFTLDAPEITDAAYDTLYHELLALQGTYPELKHADSVTERVIGGALPELKKVKQKNT